MSDLIRREAALAILHECGGDEITPPNMIEMRGRMYKLPAVDAVEVVRCCVCEWWNTEEVGMAGDTYRCERFSLVGYSENYTDPMDFCSYGKRREEI